MQNQRVVAIVIINATFIMVAMAASYGKFDLSYNSYEICKGPRRKDCARLIYNITPGIRIQNVFLEIFENTTVDTAQISAFKPNSSKRAEPIYNLKLTDPCRQSAIGGKLDFWDVSGKNCIAKEGKYNYSVDPYSLTEKLWDGNFLYGNFMFKITYYGPKCNMICSLFDVTYSPKQ